MKLYQHGFESPIGAMTIIASDNGVHIADFVDRPDLVAAVANLKARLEGSVFRDAHPHGMQAQQELEEYFAGGRQSFDCELAPSGSTFQIEVWNALREIPHGQTRTYMQHAVAMGRPDACRAVGVAIGRNFIEIIIPCHRVVGSDDSLTGYGGGLHRKKWLLDHEGSTLFARV